MKKPHDEPAPSAEQRPIRPLQFGDVFLRSLESADLDRLYRWQNDATLYDSLVGAFRPVSRETVLEWLRTKMAWSDYEINLAIALVTTGQHIGNIYLRKIDTNSSQAEVHVYIGHAEDRGLGFGRQAMRCMLTYAFETLGLHRVYLHVLASNVRAVRMYEFLGFKREGCLRQHVRKGQELADVLVMGLLAQEYRIAGGDTAESSRQETE